MEDRVVVARPPPAYWPGVTDGNTSRSEQAITRPSAERARRSSRMGRRGCILIARPNEPLSKQAEE